MTIVNASSVHTGPCTIDPITGVPCCSTVTCGTSISYTIGACDPLDGVTLKLTNELTVERIEMLIEFHRLLKNNEAIAALLISDDPDERKKGQLIGNYKKELDNGIK